MRFLGAGLWSLFLLLAIALERREAARTLAELGGLCRLTAHMKEQLSVAPTPLPRIYATFENEALSRVGFLTCLRKSGLAAALTAHTLSLSEETLRPFLEYAKGLGTRPYREEYEAAKRAHETAVRMLSDAEETYPRKRRLTGTLFFTGGMLLLLLLI